MFPIKPLFDYLIVREIPAEDTLTEEEKKMTLFGDSRASMLKLRNRQGVVVAVGPDAEKHVSVDDRVHFEDTAMYEQVYMRPIDEIRPAPEKYWKVRVQDLKGIAVESVFEGDIREVTCENCGDKILSRHQCFAVKVHA